MTFNTASDILDPVKLNYCPFPCGTPEVTGAISDDSPSRIIVCVRFDKKAEIQFNVSFLIP
jgi:hypothetical protein